MPDCKLTSSKKVTVAPYDPFSHSEQVYLGSMNVELSFIKEKRTNQQFDGDALAKEFIAVFPPTQSYLPIGLSKPDIRTWTNARHGFQLLPDESRRYIH